MSEDKCLVEEARDKCQCDWCKQSREMTKITLKQIMEWEKFKIWMDEFEKKTKENLTDMKGGKND